MHFRHFVEEHVLTRAVVPKAIRCDCFLPVATKLDQGNIFTSVCQEFCPQGESACWDTPPWDQAPPPRSRHPPGADTPPGPDTPRTRHHPPRADPPGPDTPHPPGADPLPHREADCSMRSTSSRYASYWNAFLFIWRVQQEEV